MVYVLNSSSFKCLVSFKVSRLSFLVVVFGDLMDLVAGFMSDWGPVAFLNREFANLTVCSSSSISLVMMVYVLKQSLLNRLFPLGVGRPFSLRLVCAELMPWPTSLGIESLLLLDAPDLWTNGIHNNCLHCYIIRPIIIQNSDINRRVIGLWQCITLLSVWQSLIYKFSDGEISGTECNARGICTKNDTGWRTKKSLRTACTASFYYAIVAN